MAQKELSFKSKEAFDWMRNIEPEPSHVEQVAHLALQLYDQLHTEHLLNSIEREWLLIASWLHDIGWVRRPDGKGHHKASAALILEKSWNEISKNEALIISQVARYHRKALPNESHLTFWSLDLEAQTAVRKLAAILRLADSLDHAHLSRVQGIQCEIFTDKIQVNISGHGDFVSESASFEKKKDLAEYVFKKQVFLGITRE